MGVCNSPYIFHENILEIFKGFDMVRAYIDYIIVTKMNEFVDHLRAPEKVLQKLVEAELKLNTEKYFLGGTENK